MAIGTPVSIGTTADKTAGATTVLTTTAAVPAGALICVCYAVDGDGADANGEIQGITDSASNTYVVAQGLSTGVTNSFVAGGVYYVKNAAALASGSTITLDWTGTSTPTAKAVSAFYATGIDTTAPLDVVGTASDTSTAPSVSTSASTTQADVLTIGIVATEGPSTDTFTQDASPAYGNVPVRVGWDTGTATQAVTVAGGYFIETATGVKTYNPTLGTSREWKAIIATFKGAAAGGAIAGTTTTAFTPSGTMVATGALAGSSVVAFAPAGAMTGAAGITGSSTVSLTGTATALASMALAGTATLSVAPTATAAATGTLTGTATLTVTPTATALGAGALAGASTLTFTPTATLDVPAGQLAGTSIVSFAPTATALATGSLVGSSVVAFAPTAPLIGAAEIAGSLTVSLDSTGTALGAGTLTGSVVLLFAPTGTGSGAVPWPAGGEGAEGIRVQIVESSIVVTLLSEAA